MNRFRLCCWRNRLSRFGRFSSRHLQILGFGDLGLGPGRLLLGLEPGIGLSGPGQGIVLARNLADVLGLGRGFGLRLGCRRFGGRTVVEPVVNHRVSRSDQDADAALVSRRSTPWIMRRP